MQLELVGKHALVCGASKGIGLASAKVLAGLGASVTLLARSETTLQQAVAKLPCPHDQQHDFGVVDFTDYGEIDAALESIVDAKPISILVNNSGGPPGGPLIDADAKQFERAFGSHLIANQRLVQCVLPGMRASNYGRVINIISTSVREPIAGLGVSNTIRGAVASWAKTLAGELGPDQITVNNVLPGFTDTERLQALIAGWAQQRTMSATDLAESMRAQVPLGRFASAEEVANLVGFLASPAASYISGQSIAADGGRTRSI